MSMLALALLFAMQDETFSYSEWQSWAEFEAGSTVTHEAEVGGQKVKMTSTIKSKAETEITLETSAEMNGMKVPTGERTIAKPTGPESKPDPTCPKCKKEHFGKPTVSKEKIQIAGKDVDTTVIELVSTSCEGKELGRSKTWYSKDVPGWIVKLEAAFAKSSTKQMCLSFETKKK